MQTGESAVCLDRECVRSRGTGAGDAHVEHVGHVRDSRGIPAGDVCIEIHQVTEELFHVGDGRDAPLGNGAVRRNSRCHVTIESFGRFPQIGRACKRRRLRYPPGRRHSSGDDGGGDGGGGGEGDGEGESPSRPSATIPTTRAATATIPTSRATVPSTCLEDTRDCLGGGAGRRRGCGGGGGGEFDLTTHRSNCELPNQGGVGGLSRSIVDTHTGCSGG